MTKSVALADAIAMMSEGAVEMLGGVMGVGSPHRLIDELVRQRRGGRTLIFNETEGSAGAMSHRSRTGSKIVERCSLPIRSIRRVDLVVTKLAVIHPTPAGLMLQEAAPMVSVREVLNATDATLILSPGLAV